VVISIGVCKHVQTESCLAQWLCGIYNRGGTFLVLSKQIGEEYKNWYERYLYTLIIFDSFLFMTLVEYSMMRIVRL